MKNLKLTTKISVITVFLITVSIVVLGFNFDTFLKDNYFERAKEQISYAKDIVAIDFKSAEEELKTGIEFMQRDNSIIASVDLINNYQNKDNYNSALLDEEKKDITRDLLEKVKVSFNSTISLYGKDEELISYIYKDEKGYKMNFISYENSKALLYSKYESEKVYKKSIYLENEIVSYKHTNYYSEPELLADSVITYRSINNNLHIQSHASIFYQDDINKTLVHIEMSKTFDDEYFHKVSSNLNVRVSMSEKGKNDIELFKSNGLIDIDIYEKKNNYFAIFTVMTSDGGINIDFSLDKNLLNSALNENRKQLFVYLLISIVLMLIFFSFLMRYEISRPVESLMKQIGKIKDGDYSSSDILETADELEVISSNINMLAVSVANREQALKDSQKQLEYLSVHDELTGLTNRRSFAVKLDYALKMAHRNGTRVAVFFLDLDQFKQVNDTLGHTVGDNLLKTVARRLEASLRKSDVLARVGGDEFNIFIEGFDNITTLQTFAQNLLNDFIEPFVNIEHEIVTSASIGIAIYPDDGLDSETLIKNADLAMYASKDRGRNSYSFYEPKFSKYLQKRMDIVQALKLAIKNQSEFLLYYQPKISIKTQKIVAVEALIRWNSSDLGFVRPDEFISVAEETHLIIDIGKWVLNQACKDFVLLKKRGYKLEQMSVNISAVQLLYSDLFKTVKEVIASTDMSATELELEVTESYIATNEESAIETLSNFRDMGIELAIDDFGTGHSSMSYLQKLPITRLKIDKAFVDNLPDSTESVAVVKAIIALAEAFNLKITVEGVETKKQLDFFKDKYCEDIQGYYYSKPLPIDELREFIKENLSESN